jgi:HK97 family phage major capsid protein
MNPEALRLRANEALVRARELETRCAGDAATAEDQTNLDAALNEAQALFDQAGEAEARSARLRALEERGNAPGERQGAPFVPGAHTDAANTRNGRHRYDVSRAVNAQLRGAVVDGLEGEVHNDLVRFRGGTKGVLVPLDTEISYRAFSAAGATSTVVRGPIQQALMSRLVLAQAGAQQMVSPTLFKLPLATSGSTYWVTNASPTAADRSIGSVAFTAHTIAGKTKIDRQTLTTANLDTQAYIWDQLLRDIAVAYQTGCFHGTNGSGQPKGLFAYSGSDGVNVQVQGTNGAALTQANLLAMVSAVETANAYDGLSWITNPSVTGKLEGTAKESGYPVYCYNALNKTIIDRPVFSTSSVSKALTKGTSSGVCSALAFGDFTRAVMAMFSAIDVFANPYSDDGGTTLSAFLDCDFGLTQPTAFSICVDALTA